MKMQFQRYAPHPLLKNYIEKIWVFNSSGPIPRDDMKLIMPTGRIKLMLPFRNLTTVKLNGVTQHSKGHDITLVGLADTPVMVDSEADDPSGTIGIEFSPDGAYRFFRLNFNDIKNQMYPLTDIFGKIAGELMHRVADAGSDEGKVDLLQQFLIRQYGNYHEDPIFDFCVRKIKMSKGLITVKELEKQTGYSSRWLNIKFIERVGVSPKSLSEIFRFQAVYRALTKDSPGAFDLKLFYDYYYDQSHFIRDFKRFTGMPPLKLAKAVNDFGKLYYKE